VEQFATAILPLIDPETETAVRIATEAVNRFPAAFSSAWADVFGAKLGLRGWHDGDGALVNGLLQAMQTGGADFTNTFAGLANGSAHAACADPAPLDTWAEAYDARLKEQGGPDRAAMARANPTVIPRNHQVEAMIAAAVAGDFAPFHRLLATVTRPFAADAPDDLRRPPAADEEVHATFCGT